MSSRRKIQKNKLKIENPTKILKLNQIYAMLLIPQLKNYKEVLCKYLPSYWCVLDCFAVAAILVLPPYTSLPPVAEMCGQSN